MDRPFLEPFKPYMVVGDQTDTESRARDSLLLMARLRSPALAETFAVRIRNLSAGGLRRIPGSRPTPSRGRSSSSFCGRSGPRC